MSGQDMKCFGFEDNLVRVVMKSGAPWFVAADVCRVLGLKNTAMAVKSLDEDERGVSSTYTLGGSRRAILASSSAYSARSVRSGSRRHKPRRNRTMTLDHIITASIGALTAIFAAVIFAIAIKYRRRKCHGGDAMEFEEPQPPKQHPIWRDEL